jgi:PleD family two-component response regulator
MKRASRKKNSRYLERIGRTTATKGRILEVDDAEAIREIITAICKSRGFDVIQARCSDEALNLYRKCGPFVLVLSDLYWYDGAEIEPRSALVHSVCNSCTGYNDAHAWH